MVRYKILYPRDNISNGNAAAETITKQIDVTVLSGKGGERRTAAAT
jgi:hypothetical protein